RSYTRRRSRCCPAPPRAGRSAPRARSRSTPRRTCSAQPPTGSPPGAPGRLVLDARHPSALVEVDAELVEAVAPVQPGRGARGIGRHVSRRRAERDLHPAARHPHHGAALADALAVERAEAADLGVRAAAPEEAQQVLLERLAGRLVVDVLVLPAGLRYPEAQLLAPELEPLDLRAQDRKSVV